MLNIPIGIGDRWEQILQEQKLQIYPSSHVKQGINDAERNATQIKKIDQTIAIRQWVLIRSASVSHVMKMGFMRKQKAQTKLIEGGMKIER